MARRHSRTEPEFAARFERTSRAWRGDGGWQGRIFPAGHQWRVVSDDFTRSFDYRVEAVRAEINWNLRIWRQLSLDSIGNMFKSK